MMRPLVILAIMLSPALLSAAELKRVYRSGEPILDIKEGWKGHIDYASWVDDDTIVFAQQSVTAGELVRGPGQIICLSLETGKKLWSRDGVPEIHDWSFSPDTKRLAYLCQKNWKFETVVVDCMTGKALLHATESHLATLLDVAYVGSGKLTLDPTSGRLAICSSSSFYGKNGYVLDPNYRKVEMKFPVDARPKEVRFSADGKRISSIAKEDVVCVYDLKDKRQVFFRGKRIKTEPAAESGTIDAPFVSHVFHDGSDTLIYSEDNSWSSGKVHVLSMKDGTGKAFDARNGHIEMDVDFKTERIVLTGNSTDLTVVDFAGKEIAHQKKATLQRNSSVSFSPAGKRILVGSWDNTASVFEIVE